ncbi:hypothetical protein P8A21_39965 (plasmid) [Streptomyces poriferorum]|uniref:hypothetical protein n=1 Tax=Streptomyces poriferorum TaxID=2798799 RepID=UPI00273DA0E1|nr:hypothetical protein [Streptomyces sp. Alt1]WLQ53721.1 hypothetical protein P8A21_39965 [Streptomyces sp. Alt1]
MADSTLTGSFHATLAHVVASTTWSGRVPVPENGLMASAVSFLGTEIGNRAWWLHYTRRPTMQPLADRAHVLTLIAPCECGTYINVELTDEDFLIVLLDELDTPPGTPVPCDRSLRIRRNSHSDNRHASTSPRRNPFTNPAAHSGKPQEGEDPCPRSPTSPRSNDSSP